MNFKGVSKLGALVNDMESMKFSVLLIAQSAMRFLNQKYCFILALDDTSNHPDDLYLYVLPDLKQ